MKIKSQLLVTLLIGISVILINACSKTDNGPDNPDEQEAQYIAFLNPLDQNFLRVENDSAFVTYSGEKNANGIPTQLQNVVYEDKRSGEEFFYAFDEQVRPTRAWSSNGEILDFIYDEISGRISRIQATTSDGTVVSFPAFAEDVQKPTSSSLKSSRTKGGRIEVSSKPYKESLAKSSQLKITEQDLIINFTQCGFPLESDYVNIRVKGNEQILSSQVWGTKLGNGAYSFKIPDPSPISNENVTDYCNGFTSTVGTACTAVSVATFGGKLDPAFACASLGTAVDALTALFPGDGIAVFATCDRILRTLTKVCNFISIGAGSDIIFDDPNAPSLDLGVVCSLSDLVDDMSSEFSVRPQVLLPGNGFVQNQLEPFTISAVGPFSPKTINIDGDEIVDQFRTSPADPGPGANYVANAIIICGTPGTQATISITGTDGFTDSRTITLNASRNEIGISVPGAEQGIRDVISISLASGQQKSISIIF